MTQSQAEPSEPLSVDRRGSVVLLTLDRPHRLNAVSLPLYRALFRQLTAAARDEEVRCVVVTGRGRAFCVGADLKAHGEGRPSPEERSRYARAAQRVNRRIQRLPVPVVAAVNGHAVGAGLELALSADLVVVDREAKLRFPEVALGTFVGGGVTYTLPARVGQLRARELLLVADFLSGERAAELGLANRAVEKERVLEVALEMAETVARHAPRSVRWAKRLLNEAAAGKSHDRLLFMEARTLVRLMGTRDWKEGIDAFHEKREPRFTGE